MKFTTDYTIEQIKTHISMLDVADEFGLKMRRAGRSYKGYCPFHSEKTPSFSIKTNGDSTKDFFNCFGCGERGDQINLYAKLKGINNKQAIKDLAERLGLNDKKIHDEDKKLIESRVERRQRIREEKKNYNDVFHELSDIVQAFNHSRRLVETMEDAELLAPVYHLQPYYEYLLDGMLGNFGKIDQVYALSDAEGVVEEWNSLKNN